MARQAPATVGVMLESNLTLDRRLDRGNATQGNVSTDYARFNIDLWSNVDRLDSRNPRRRVALDQVNAWRNAIVHDSPLPSGLVAVVAGTRPTLTWCRRWRTMLTGLAPHVDEAVRLHLQSLIGSSPW